MGEPVRRVQVLTDAELKLQRAREHLRRLDALVSAYLNSRPYRTFGEYDEYDPAGARIKGITFTRQPPQNVGLVLGDAIHCLRSTLDYALYRAVVAEGGKPPPGMNFPIARPSEWKGQATRIGKWNLPAGMATAVESLQPWDGGQLLPEHPLWTLQQLANIEKHRRLHLTTVWMHGAEHLDFLGPGQYHVFRGEGPKEGQAVARTFWFERSLPSDTDMKVHLQGSLHVVLQEKRDLGGRRPVGPLIRQIAEFIEDRALPVLQPDSP